MLTFDKLLLLSSERAGSSRGENNGNTLKRGPSLKPKFDGVSAASPFFSPLRKSFLNTIKLVFGCSSKVISLLFRGCPSAVSWGVPKVIVNSVNRHTFWALAHCSKKRREVVSPLVTDSDTSTAPQVKPMVCRVVAPVFHMGPYAVAASFSEPVRSFSLGCGFSLEASA